MKQRLVGAAVLMALGVIFIPIFLAPEDGDTPPQSSIEIDRAVLDEQFSSKVQPIEDSELSILQERADNIVPLGGTGELPPEVETDLSADDEQLSSESETGNVAESKELSKPEQERIGVTAWVVQAGSFSSRENAEKLANRLKAKGFSAYIEDIVADKPAFRVRIGPLLSKARAQQTAQSLKKSLDVDGMIVKYQ